MPQMEEIRGGPRPSAALWPAQEAPPGYPPAWYAPPKVEEPPAPGGTVSKLTYSVDEAAQVLGVSRCTLYKLIHRSDFPALKVGNRQLISREGLAEWVRRQAGGQGMGV